MKLTDAIEVTEFLTQYELPLVWMFSTLKELELQTEEDRKEWFEHCVSNLPKTNMDYFVIDCINEFFPHN